MGPAGGWRRPPIQWDVGAGFITSRRVLTADSPIRGHHPTAQACAAGAPARRQQHLSRERRLRREWGGPVRGHPRRGHETGCRRMATDDWRLSWIKRAQVAAIAGVGYPLANALGHTLRWRVEGLNYLDAIHASGRQPVMAFWHGRILPVLLPAAVLSSLPARTLTASGSPELSSASATAPRAARRRAAGSRRCWLVRDMEQGRPAGFTLDGPRGPALVAQPGIWRRRDLPFHASGRSELGPHADSAIQHGGVGGG